MNPNLLPVRPFIHESIKAFPWSFSTQPNAICAYIDTLIAARHKSRRACLRAGLWDLSDRQLQYSLKQAASVCPEFQQFFSKRFLDIDPHRTYYLSFDDTSTPRYGKNVYGAAHQYDHSRNGTHWSNVFVDGVVSSDRILAITHDVYLPKAFLTRQGIDLKELETKIQLARQQAATWRTSLLRQGVPPHRIWHTLDCWYTSQKFTEDVRQSGANLMMGVKKDTQCNLFGDERELQDVFHPDDDWYYRTNPTSGQRIWFQSKTLNLTNHGRCQVFAIRRGKEKRIRYYASTRPGIMIETALHHLRAHWRVETLHREIKQLFGLNHCYSGAQEMNEIHWTLVYWLAFLFTVYQDQLATQGIQVTLPQLWNHYCFHYDEERAKKCFTTRWGRAKAIKHLWGD